MLDYYYNRSMARTSFTLVMLAVAGSMALLLGVVGLYGVIAYSVSQRRREVSIRMALGAGKSAILNMIIGQGIKLVLIGVAIGLVGALGLTRFLSDMLYGVKPADACRSFRASHGSGALGLLYSSSSGGQSRSDGGATS